MQNKVLIIVGVILVVLSVLGLVYGGIPEERHAIQIGEASIGITETREIPPWLSWSSLVAGIILATVGVVRK